MKLNAKHAAPTLVLTTFILLLSSQLISPGALGVRDNPYLAVIILQLLIFTIPTIIFCRLRGKNYIKKLRLALFPARTVPFIVMCTFVMILASFAVKFLIYSTSSAAPEASNIYETFMPAGTVSVTNTLYMALAFAVLPAVTEELLFRSVLLAEYEVCGAGAAVLFSSVFFAMLHFDFILFPVYLVSGIILALCAYVTRSVIAPMIVHAANNLFAFFFEDSIWISILQQRNIVIFVFTAVALLLLCTMLMLGEAAHIYRRLGNTNANSSYVIPKDKRERVTGMLTSPALALCLVLFVVITIIVN